MNHIAYETWSRVEANDVTKDLPSSLRALTKEQLYDMEELLASSFARGIEAGFGIAEFAGEDLIGLNDAYVAGYQKAKSELEGDE